MPRRSAAAKNGRPSPILSVATPDDPAAEWVSPDSLVPWPKNPQKNVEAAVQAIAVNTALPFQILPSNLSSSETRDAAWMPRPWEPWEEAHAYALADNKTSERVLSIEVRLRDESVGPGPIETVNDLDAYVANFWRSVAHDPEAVAKYADWPVNEDDLHARHKWRSRRQRSRSRGARPRRRAPPPQALRRGASPPIQIGRVSAADPVADDRAVLLGSRAGRRSCAPAPPEQRAVPARSSDSGRRSETATRVQSPEATRPRFDRGAARSALR